MEPLPLKDINTLYKFVCSDELTDRVLERIKTEQEWLRNARNNISKDDFFFDSELFDWFDECIFKVKEKVGLPKNLDLPITSCWLNKATKLQAHHLHAHQNSVISGVFYLTTHLSGETYFEIPNHWLTYNSGFNYVNKPLVNFPFKILPTKSTLILFPATLNHSVLGLTKNEVRYTLSFNTFYSGEVDDGNNRTRLVLKPQTVRDYHSET